MVVIRITNKLAKRARAALEASPPRSTGLLGDWYANILVMHHQHIVLAVSEKTLLPVLMPAKDIASLPTRLPVALDSMLRRLEIPQDKIDAELVLMTDWTYAKTASKQVLGSMNDFANMLWFHLEDGGPLEDHAIRLGRSPCSPIGSDPLRATAALFGGAVPASVYSL